MNNINITPDQEMAIKEKETSQLLASAAAEIQSLRRQNNIMAEKLHVFDSMMLMFKSRPDYPQTGTSEDVVYKIYKHIEQNKG